MKVEQSKRLYEIEKIKDIKEMLNRSSKLYKNNIAFKYKEENELIEITYGKLQEDVDKLGTALMNMGLKDKKIAIIGENSYSWCVAYLATVCGLGIVVPIDKALPINEIQNIVEKSKSEAIFFDNKYIEKMSEIKNESNTLKHLVCFKDIENSNNKDIIEYEKLIKKGEELLEKNDNSYMDLEVNENEMRIILFTSGTTSNSKGVMLSHKNICSNIMGLAECLKYEQDDILLSFLPIHHTFESTVTFLAGLYNGSSIALCKGLRYIIPSLLEYKITIFVTVPLVLENLYKKVLQQIDESGGKYTGKQIINSIAPNLRLTLVGAAPLSKEAIVGLRSFGIDVHQGYGLTETSPILSLETDDRKRAGSIGVSLPEVEIEIDNPDEEGLGEIKAKGTNVMLGYYEDEEETKKVLKDNWFYTGDLGYVDEDGFLFISGRKKNVIVLKNGKNIFPEEIENLINSNPYVSESFVHSKIAKNGDVKICAKIVYNKEILEEKYKGIKEEEIIEMMVEHKKNINQTLPLYKYIRDIEVTDTPLSKTTTGKIKRYDQKI